MNAPLGLRLRTIAYVLIPVAVAALLVIYSFRLTGRFKTNPSLQERLQDVTLTKEQHYRPAYRIVSSEFVCAGNASWYGGGGGIWVRNGWTTSKAIFKCLLEELAPRRSYVDDDTFPRETRDPKGPIYLEVTDVFGRQPASRVHQNVVLATDVACHSKTHFKWSVSGRRCRVHYRVSGIPYFMES